MVYKFYYLNFIHTVPSYPPLAHFEVKFLVILKYER